MNINNIEEISMSEIDEYKFNEYSTLSDSLISK